MTDNERMDRAKRIREMREGARDDGGESPSDETDENRTDGGDPEPEAGGDGETASPGGGQTGPNATDDGGDTAADAVGQTEEEAASENGGDPAESAAEPDEETVPGDVTAPLPEMDELEAALDGSESTVEPETVAPGVADSADERAAPAGSEAVEAGQAEIEATTEEETRVLEFTLDDEHYCLDIQYIEEIVKHENITRVPNTPDHVEGVVDLRGQITTILNPKVTIGKENDEAGELIVVFDAEAFEDQGYIGWVVDDVRQVSPIVESEVNDPPMAEEYVNGVIDRDDDEEFVIWTSPDLAFEGQE